MQRGRRLGHITKFPEANTHRFHNHVAARDGIGHGIKLLVCEKLLGGKGVAAIFIFRFTSLRTLKCEELNALKDAIEEQGSKSIKKLAGQKADWLGRCQSIYNGKWLWLAFTQLNILQYGTKRPLEPTSFNLPQEQEPNVAKNELRAKFNRRRRTASRAHVHIE